MPFPVRVRTSCDISIPEGGEAGEEDGEWRASLDLVFRRSLVDDSELIVIQTHSDEDANRADTISPLEF
jgi:hypothetical protein